MNKWVFRISVLILSLIFLVSAGFLADYFIKSQKHAAQFDDLSALVDQAQQQQKPLPTEPTGSNANQQDSSSSSEPTNPPENPHVTVTHPETGEELQILREYAPIFLKNPDLVGWMKIIGTKLNYPVVQSIDSPNYYLHRDFYGEYSNHGCIYVNEACDVEAPSDNLTIYGHRMKDGSMFAMLHQYMDEDFYWEHPIIIFDTLTEHHSYEILSVFLTTASVGQGFPYHEFVNAKDETEFDVFVGRCKDLALYNTGVDANYGDKLITLSTCEYSQTNGRLVVVAKRIS